MKFLAADQEQPRRSLNQHLSATPPVGHPICPSKPERCNLSSVSWVSPTTLLPVSCLWYWPKCAVNNVTTGHAQRHANDFLQNQIFPCDLVS